MQVTPLPQGFGVEVTQFDLATGGSLEEIALLRQAFNDHHLVAFRSEAGISPERQVEITGWFGPVLAEGTAWTVLDNAEATGRLALPFHSDITFLEHPLAGISLYPQELPAGSTSTTFISNAVAWDRLPDEMQRGLAHRRARHSFVSGDEIDLGLPSFEYWHPACMHHRETGRPLLFVTEHHVDLIEGMTPEGSAQVLAVLFDTLYAPERRYEHVWRKGDLLIWDNIAIQHARTQIAEVAQGKRVMRRVQLGTIGFLEQVARLRGLETGQAQPQVS